MKILRFILSSIAIVLTFTVLCQSPGGLSDSYAKGLEYQKTRNIASQEKAIKQFQAAKSDPRNKSKIPLINNAIAKSRQIIEELRSKTGDPNYKHDKGNSQGVVIAIDNRGYDDILALFPPSQFTLNEGQKQVIKKYVNTIGKDNVYCIAAHNNSISGTQAELTNDNKRIVAIKNYLYSLGILERNIVVMYEDECIFEDDLEDEGMENWAKYTISGN